MEVLKVSSRGEGRRCGEIAAMLSIVVALRVMVQGDVPFGDGAISSGWAMNVFL